MTILRYKQDYSTDKYYFSDTSFDKLMQNRIINVLLVCSNYDAYMLEEDGRIEEQLFHEYASLNLRYPPQFTQVANLQEALYLFETRHFDLVIIMLSTDKSDSIEIANALKKKTPNIRIVLLTHFTRKVSEKVANQDLSSIDYVFCWLGHSSLLLAIVKLLEDRMNAEHDITMIGTQAILLVEDSIRFYSSYLPNIYKVLLQQSDELTTDALNALQSSLRKRGRPKLLLATNYEDAVEIYEKYKSNLLGIISDISFKRNKIQDDEAGLKFCEHVKSTSTDLPFLLQSSDTIHTKFIEKYKVGFIYKYSKTLIQELTQYLKEQFLFGDFIFRDPKTNKEIGRAEDLKSLQKVIINLRDDSVIYHSKQNHFSKWLKTRSMFSLARLLEEKTCEDFDNPSQIKFYIADSIKNYRVNKSWGQIASFDKEKFDKYVVFSRIGEGSIGGKARGLAFLNTLLKQQKLIHQFKDVFITIPHTVVIASDLFDEFMESNKLYKKALMDLSDEAILKIFMSARLPKRLTTELKSYLLINTNPIAVRSSSLLEDSYYQPFAGIYSTYFVANNHPDMKVRRHQIYMAIKSVYASVFYKESKAYMSSTSNVIDEEKMSIVLQEIIGTNYGKHYYPSFSGVARSINFYPISPEQSSDGVANIALGLGKMIVEGGLSLRFSPKYPKKIIQLSSPEMILKNTQNKFYALSMHTEDFKSSVDESVNLKLCDVSEAENDNSLQWIASTYDFQNHIIRDSHNYQGKKLITFAGILNYEMFPLSDILSKLLEIGQREMNCPVEIEFAVNLNVPSNEPKQFNLLQIRPIVRGNESCDINVDKINFDDVLVYSKSALGNGSYEDVQDVIYVKPQSFNAAYTKQIADKVGELNEKLYKEGKNYILIGPGRWGSSDSWLGIPVKWAQISSARVIVEAGLPNFRIDPSQGSHFFQNLTSLGVGYFTINDFIGDGKYNVDYFDAQPAVYEDEFLRHLSFKTPLSIKIDGKKNLGLIFKDEK